MKNNKTFNKQILQWPYTSVTTTYSKTTSKKTLQVIAMCLTFLLLQACELLTNKRSGNPAPVTKTDGYELCVNPLQNETFADFCSLDRWLMFVFEASTMTWSERSLKITEMGEDSRSLLLKILLSQATDTPYSQRLRAQNWVVKILSSTSPAMHKILDELVYQNSQQLLEFESAITLLSRVNTRQQKTIIELQTQLDAREDEIKVQIEQVDQLLKIETDLIEKNRSEKR